MLRTWIICLLLAAFASHAPARIAVADLTEIFKSHPETARAEKELMEKRREAGRDFNSKANELKGLLAEHQKLTTRLIDAGEKASAEEKAKANEILTRATELETELAEIRTRQERDLEQGFLAERKRILESIAEVIAAFNEDGRYSLILDSSASSGNGLPQVLHAPGAEDVTAEIVSLLAKEGDAR